MNILIKTDPTGAFSHVSEDDIMEACGLLPYWATDMSYLHLPIKEAMEEQYGFGPLIQIKEVRLDEDGTWNYPGDPPLKPLLRIERGEETLYQYKYGLVAFVSSSGEVFATRMD